MHAWSWYVVPRLVLGLVVAAPVMAMPVVATPVAAAPVAGQDSARGPDSVTAFVHVNVVPMDRERVLADQTVLVQDGRITALGPAARVRVPAGATRIDGRGKYLIPGLADMHVHLGFHDTAEKAVGKHLFSLLANGVTTVRDMHSGGRTGGRNGSSSLPQTWILELRRKLASGEVLGPRLYTAGDPDRTSPAAAAHSVAELKADGHDFVKVATLAPGYWPAMQPLYDSIITAAHRVGLRVVGHVPMGLPLARVLADRWASTEHLYGFAEDFLGLSGRWDLAEQGSIFAPPRAQAVADTAPWMKPGYRLDQAKLRAFAAQVQRAGVWTCPSLYLFRGLVRRYTPDPSADNYVNYQVATRISEFHLQITKALQEAGAGLLLCSDVVGYMPPSAYAIHEELALLVDEAGLTPYQALAMGTRNVAEFMGTRDSTGTVAVGKRADLVLLYGNPLADIRHAIGPAGVMVHGRWLSRAAIERRYGEWAAGF